uniref:NADH:quinone oxidoreductase/Mrp antiporter transmembrane domain-containing protein n=1 Tax=Salix viminalis TaxID=40686 RepID=A0A6N2MWJ6_SALVM
MDLLALGFFSCQEQVMIEYVLFILTKWRNGYPNAKNIHDVQYLIISFSCITGHERLFCRIGSIFWNNYRQKIFFNAKNTNYFGAAVGTILTPIYLLSMLRQMFYGYKLLNATNSYFFDSGPRELFVSIAILLPVISIGLYWLTGSFEFQDLFEIFNNLISNNDNEVHFLFVTLCAFLLFSGAIAKSAQFPLHMPWKDLPYFGSNTCCYHGSSGNFFVARLLPLFVVIPYIMKLIALIGIITVLLGATLAFAQKDIKRGLAYSTMSQLGYMMLALGMGSYRAALFHLITHAYSKALLFLGSGSIIHSMEGIVGYSPDKSQNMVLMGGLTKHVPITKIAFLLGTLSLCGIPPLACFWSKDEILNDSLSYSPIFAIIAFSTAGLTAFYMFRVYLLTFEGI